MAKHKDLFARPRNADIVAWQTTPDETIEVLLTFVPDVAGITKTSIDAKYDLRCRQLKQVEVEDELSFIAGYNSGFGAKPNSGPLLAFAKAVTLPPAKIAIVGEDCHVEPEFRWELETAKLILK